MALKAKHLDIEFGVGDRIRVIQKIKEKDRQRLQAFEGVVIKIKGEAENKTFTVRRIGVQQLGIERIFPLKSPVITKIEIVKKGVRGIRRAKLYYIREKSKREIEEIYTKNKKREEAKSQKNKIIKKSRTGRKGSKSSTGKKNKK